MGRLISVVSGKGGVGKTTLSVSLARHLVMLGHSALLVDTDWGMCSAGYLLEHAAAGVYTLLDVLRGQTDFADVVNRQSGLPDFVSVGGQPLTQEQTVQLADLLQQVAQDYDFVVIDRPAGLDFTLEQEMDTVYPLLVCGADALSIHGAREARIRLEEVGHSGGGLIINRFVPRLIKKKTAPDIDTICDGVGVGLMGVVPMDEQVLTDLLADAFHPKAPYNKAVDRIARRLAGESVPLPKLSKLAK